jgi:hypothetical protein
MSYTSCHKAHHEKSQRHITYTRNYLVNKLNEKFGEDWSKATIEEMGELLE